MWEEHQYQLAKDRKLHDFLNRLVVVTWDPATFSSCKAKRRQDHLIHCVKDPELFDASLRSKGLGRKALTEEVGAYTKKAELHQIYTRMTWRKVEYVAHSLALGLSTMVVDADVILFKDPSVAFDRYSQDVRAIIKAGPFYDPRCPHPDGTCLTWGCPSMGAPHRCPVFKGINGGVYLAQPTDGVRRAFATMLERSKAASLDEYDQDIYAEVLGTWTRARQISSVIVAPALIQGDCGDVNKYCGMSTSVRRCSFCEKVAIHASSCGSFASKVAAMRKFRMAYEEMCGKTPEEEERVLQRLRAGGPIPSTSLRITVGSIN